MIRKATGHTQSVFGQNVFSTGLSPPPCPSQRATNNYPQRVKGETMNTKLCCTVLVVFTVALVGCATVDTTPPPSSKKILRYRLPILTPVEPDKQDQEKDGIRISVAPYTYSANTVVHKEYRLIPSLITVNNQQPAEVREIPSIAITPDTVRLKVKIYNQLERVLRLQGTVVSFQVAGKQANVPKARYEDFLNGIILPRQEVEYEVGGPDLSDLPDNATVAFLLYDIVTATDAAGNPTQRSNFEFFYTLSYQDKQKEVSSSVNRITLGEADAQLLMQRSGGSGNLLYGPGQWVSMPELD